MAISKEQLENIIRQTFPLAIIKITDLVGDQDHYLLEISDTAFTGLTLINQHSVKKLFKFSSQKCESAQ